MSVVLPIGKKYFPVVVGENSKLPPIYSRTRKNYDCELSCIRPSNKNIYTVHNISNINMMNLFPVICIGLTGVTHPRLKGRGLMEVTEWLWYHHLWYTGQTASLWTMPAKSCTGVMDSTTRS